LCMGAAGEQRSDGEGKNVFARNEALLHGWFSEWNQKCTGRP
jgi:hypothetical protein